MATSDHTLSRRQALAGLSMAGAVAATPAMAATATRSALGDSSAWDQASAAWRLVDQKFDALGDRFDAAEEAWGDADGPRVDRYFEEYRLDTSMTRDQAESALKMFNTRARLSGRAQIDATKIADEFAASLKRSADLKKHFRVDEHWDRMKAYQTTFDEVRDAIMKIPAPHVAALLIKIEIAAISLDDEHAESVLADARRLLSNGRA